MAAEETDTAQSERQNKIKRYKAPTHSKYFCFSIPKGCYYSRWMSVTHCPRQECCCSLVWPLLKTSSWWPGWRQSRLSAAPRWGWELQRMPPVPLSLWSSGILHRTTWLSWSLVNTRRQTWCKTHTKTKGLFLFLAKKAQHFAASSHLLHQVCGSRTNWERPREAVKAKGHASSMRKDTSSSRTGKTVTDISPICRDRTKVRTTDCWWCR